jgi:hypothetical protein
LTRRRAAGVVAVVFAVVGTFIAVVTALNGASTRGAERAFWIAATFVGFGPVGFIPEVFTRTRRFAVVLLSDAILLVALGVVALSVPSLETVSLVAWLPAGLSLLLSGSLVLIAGVIAIVVSGIGCRPRCFRVRDDGDPSDTTPPG